MMTNAIVKKMYRVFDELHQTEESAMEVLKGWEHKERIYTRYVVGYENELNVDIVNLDYVNVYLAKTEEEANEELNEWNA